MTVSEATERSPLALPPPGLDLDTLRAGSLAVMLYGSRARGKAREDSDTDILQVVSTKPEAYSVGSVNVTQYRLGTLLRMATSGSLFIHHLKSEGIILSDPQGLLAACLNQYANPRNFDAMLDDIAEAARALDPSVADENVVGRCRLGVYLLRTALYIQAAQRGIHTYDIEEIMGELGTHNHVQLALGCRHLASDSLTQDNLALLHAQLEHCLGTNLRNHHGSIEGLAISVARNQRVAPLIERLIMNEQSLDYSGLSLPPF